MMILEKPKFDGTELAEISNEIRHSVYPPNQRQMLPVKPDDYIVWLRSLKDIPVGIESAIQSITDVNDTPDTHNTDAEKYDTGVIDSFNTLLLDAQKDIKSVYKPTWTNSLNLNNIIRDGIEEYFKFRMARYVQQIYQHIQILITLDNFPETNFGDYIPLVKAFESAKTDAEKQQYLDSLILIGLSNIPFELKQNKKKSITPMLSSSIKTQ